jgi:hypothetical protein
MPRSFSERMGYVPPRALQTETLDLDTRTALWNFFYVVFFQRSHAESFLDDSEDGPLRHIWATILRRAVDTMSTGVVTTRSAFFFHLLCESRLA